MTDNSPLTPRNETIAVGVPCVWATSHDGHIAGTLRSEEHFYRGEPNKPADPGVTPEVGAGDGEGRVWHAGDVAWLPTSMTTMCRLYVTREPHWRQADHHPSMRPSWMTDAEMTSAGAVLMATADGPLAARGAVS